MLHITRIFCWHLDRKAILSVEGRGRGWSCVLHWGVRRQDIAIKADIRNTGLAPSTCAEVLAFPDARQISSTFSERGNLKIKKKINENANLQQLVCKTTQFSQHFFLFSSLFLVPVRFGTQLSKREIGEGKETNIYVVRSSFGIVTTL